MLDWLVVFQLLAFCNVADEIPPSLVTVIMALTVVLFTLLLMSVMHQTGDRD